MNLILGSVIPLNTANNQDNQGCGRCSPDKYASQIGNLPTIFRGATLSQLGLIPIMLAVITRMTWSFVGVPGSLNFTFTFSTGTGEGTGFQM